MKKFVSLLLTAVMMLSLIPFSIFSVSAAETDAQGVQYTLSEDQTYYIVSRYSGTETDIVIPETFNELPVKGIGKNAFYYCINIVSISIGKSVESIGESAFLWCAGLESITVSPDNTAYKIVDNCLIEIATKTLVWGTKNSKIPSDGSVETIKSYAFGWCDGLVGNVVIPDSVKSIEEYAFYFCSGITSVVIGDSVESIGEFAFGSCTNLATVEFGESLKTIGAWGFDNCHALDGIELPDSLETIERSAFAACYALTSINIPDTVTVINESSFGNCRSLTSVEIPDTVTIIADEAFNYCDNLQSVTIGKSVASIGREAFSGCPKLESITVSPDNATYKSIGNGVVETATKTLVIGCKATEIPSDGSVTKIGDDAFSNCGGLTSIVIPKSVTSIGYRAFYECKNLSSVSISDTVTEIGSLAFSYCSSLTSIVIPASVTVMSSGNYAAFYQCDNLTDIYCEAESKPDGWRVITQFCPATIHWGYKGEDITDDLTSKIAELEALSESDYAEEEWANIQAALESAKEFSADGKTVEEIRAEIDALETALALNPALKEFGDLNGDGEITSLDYLFVKRACFKTYDLSDAENARADIDKNGKIDSADYLLVKRIAFGTYSA